MIVTIKEIVAGRDNYDTAICDNIQIVVERGTADKFIGKKVKFENGVFTEINEQPARPQQPVKKPVK